MITVEHQDREVIILNPYTWTGEADGIYLKTPHYTWMDSVVGNDYKVLLRRFDGTVIYIDNEYYRLKYQNIEPQLVGNVLILGMGFALLDPYLVTGTDWVWVENNQWLFDNVTPTNGSKVFGDAEDELFLTTMLPTPTYDTILIDFDLSNDKHTDYDQLLNMGGTIIKMYI